MFSTLDLFTYSYILIFLFTNESEIQFKYGKVAYFRDIPNSAIHFSEQYYGVRDHVGMFS
jgi:hypothetical protein